MTDNPDRLWTSANNPTLAEMKRDWLDPHLREVGLDPDRYELTYELAAPVFTIQRPAVDQKVREQLLLAIADGLDIPPEILRIPPTEWQEAAWGHRHDLADPYGVAAFERTRREFVPRWCYVSGGKALHAFLGDSDRPACGIDPRRGPDLRPARWIGSANRDSFSRRSREHGPCRRAVQEHRSAMMRREVPDVVAG